MFIPSYIKRSRHGLYYFRAVIPMRLRPLFGGRTEIKRSLRTTDRRTARTLARALGISLEQGLDKTERLHMSGGPEDFAQAFSLTMNVDLKRGTIHVETDPDKPEEVQAAVNAIKDLTPLLTEAASNSGAHLDEADPPALAVRLPDEATGRRLSEIADEFVRLKSPTWVPRTAADYRATIQMFIQYAEDPPIRKVTRKLVNDFKVAKHGEMSPRTLDKKITILNGLFNYAINSGDLLGENPASKQMVLTNRDKLNQRHYRKFKPDELAMIFDPAHYLQGNPKPHQYWAPLVALYSGARIGEICQLLVKDFSEVDGMLCLSISPQDEEGSEHKKRVKSKAGERMLPVHPELLELGIRDYLQDVREVAGGHGLLFPYLVHTVNGYSKTASAHFGKYLNKLGLTDKNLVFHSFRSTVNDLLKQNRIDEEKRCQLLGHEHSTVNSEAYSTPYNATFLMEHVMPCIAYPEIDVAGLRYRSEVFRPRLSKEMARRIPNRIGAVL